MHSGQHALIIMFSFKFRFFSRRLSFEANFLKNITNLSYPTKCGSPKVMQELAKSLEVLGITSLEGLTKKELKKVECVRKIIHTVVDINTTVLSLLKYFLL